MKLISAHTLDGVEVRYKKLYLQLPFRLQYISIRLKWVGPESLGRFFTILYKGDNFREFLFVFMHTNPLLKWGLL